MTTSAPRCPHCDSPYLPDATGCLHCGESLATPSLRAFLAGGFADWHLPSAHEVLKRLLGLWAIAYPILIFLPLISTGTSTAGGTTVGLLSGIIVGSVLFFPWIVGIIVLAVLVYVTKPS